MIRWEGDLHLVPVVGAITLAAPKIYRILSEQPQITVQTGHAINMEIGGWLTDSAVNDRGLCDYEITPSSQTNNSRSRLNEGRIHVTAYTRAVPDAALLGGRFEIWVDGPHLCVKVMRWSEDTLELAHTVIQEAAADAADDMQVVRFDNPNRERPTVGVANEPTLIRTHDEFVRRFGRPDEVEETTEDPNLPPDDMNDEERIARASVPVDPVFNDNPALTLVQLDIHVHGMPVPQPVIGFHRICARRPDGTRVNYPARVSGSILAAMIPMDQPGEWTFQGEIRLPRGRPHLTDEVRRTVHPLPDPAVEPPF